MAAPQVQLIDTQELELYPISASDRLDSHYFLQWNLKRWRGSEFRKTCDPEVGWYGFQLFCIAQDGSPIGTLPCDDKQLAFDLNLPLEKWQALIRRGALVAYTAYSFGREADYLAAEAEARKLGRGLWADARAVAKVDALKLGWAAKRGE